MFYPREVSDSDRVVVELCWSYLHDNRVTASTVRVQVSIGTSLKQLKILLLVSVDNYTIQADRDRQLARM